MRGPPLISACVACLLGSTVAFGGVTKSVRVSGAAAIIDGDTAAAFQRAKSSALREAVERGVGTLIKSETRVQNFAVIEDHILSSTSGYVSNFTIVERGELDAKNYQVTIDASVDLGSLQASIAGLNLLAEAIDHPRIVCISRLRTSSLDGSSREDWIQASASLQYALAVQGRMEILKPRLTALEYRQAFDDPATAAVLGQELGADILVLGRIDLQSQKNIPIPFAAAQLSDFSIHSVVANAQIEAFWSDSREMIANISTSKRAAGGSFENASQIAVRESLDYLAHQLFKEIIDDWRDKVYSGRTISLTVGGSRQLADYFEREFPLRVTDIEKLYPRSFENDIAIYDAHSKSPAFDVARELSAKGLGNLDVEIVGITSNTLRLMLSD